MEINTNYIKKGIKWGLIFWAPFFLVAGFMYLTSLIGCGYAPPGHWYCNLWITIPGLLVIYFIMSLISGGGVGLILGFTWKTELKAGAIFLLLYLCLFSYIIFYEAPITEYGQEWVKLFSTSMFGPIADPILIFFSGAAVCWVYKKVKKFVLS